MRIGTWNLNHSGRRGRDLPRQLDVIQAHPADVWVLTEPSFVLSSSEDSRIASPCDRLTSNGRESWVAIVGDGVEPVGPAVPFERMAVAARLPVTDGDLILYGSVLPWLTAPTQAPAHALPGEASADMFVRLLTEQAADVAALIEASPEATVVWAGDFNQSVTGPNWGGGATRRAALLDALGRLGLEAWNGAAGHLRVGMCAVDLICGPAVVRPVTVERVASPLSDHAAYVVEV